MRNYITEPDFFHHEKPERLVVERIDIEGYHNQRTVLSTPVVRLRPFKIYDFVIRQPVPQDARGLPLYVKAIADMDFVPNVSTGFGRSDEVHWEREGIEPARHHGGHGHGPDGDDVEVVTETVQAKMFRVQMFGFGNQAFGNDLVFRNEEPYPFIPMYLNDVNEFMLLPPRREPFRHGPRRLIRKREMIIREPIHADTLGINRSLTEFVHPRRLETSEVWVEGQFCGHGRR